MCANCHTSIASPRETFGRMDFPLCFACYMAGILPPGTMAICPDCEGSGKSTCMECDGKKKHECDCGHQHMCGSCYGTGQGRSECVRCDGTGKIEVRQISDGQLILA